MESDRQVDGDSEKASLMGAEAPEADEGPVASAERPEESSPAAPSGNAFARFASAMLTRMNSITSSGANSRESSPAKEGRGATKHQIIAAAAASSAADFDSAADDAPITIRSPKSKSPSLSPRFRRKQHRSSPQPSPSSRSRTPSPRSVTSDNSATSPSGAPGVNAATGDGSACNTLTVPGYLGAIPRPPRRRYQHASSTESDSAANTELSTPLGSTAATGAGEERRCFCGYYSEQKDAAAATAIATSSTSSSGGKKKPGRCKFCRSKAKYVPGQRSFDASRFFRGGSGGGGGTEDGRRQQPRRAASEDRRSDGMTTEDTSASTSAATTAQSSFDCGPSRSSIGGFFSTPPFLRRQERLEIDPPSPNLLTVPSPIGGGSPTSSIGGGGLFYTRDHGLRTPPAPPCTVPQTTIETIPSVDEFQDIESDYRLTHRMAHEMPEYLVPPPRAAILVRAHTDPDTYDPGSSSGRTAPGPPMAPPPSPNFRAIPSSPPPAYTEVVGESTPCHNRSAPPTYEEALNSRLADQHRIPTSSRARPHLHGHHSGGGHLGVIPGNLRSLSEERTLPTAGAAAGGSASSTSSGGLRGRRAYMVRSSRAEEIPDIYWEQAARELDFCTCRKCQARYRQYFEEDPAMASVVSGDATGIPMETQYLMQEVLTDGMAFCSLM